MSIHRTRPVALRASDVYVAAVTGVCISGPQSMDVGGHVPHGAEHA